MIHFALRNPHTLTLIVTPGLRQSMIVMDRIQDQIGRIEETRRKRHFKLLQRTVITCRNGSRLVALPCSPNTLRGYAASEVLIDEAAFIRDDQTIFYNVLFPMLQTTRGALIASSTPWGKDSVFYQFTQDPAFKLHKVTIGEVIKAGLATQDFVDEMERRTPRERFRREYLAEFVEDELAYFPQNLITECIDSNLAPITDDWTKKVTAEPDRYFMGVDLGKKVDYSALAIIRWNTKEDYGALVGHFRFPLETPYASVIGYVKVICDKLQRVEKVLVDRTGVGEYIVEEMQNVHIRSTIEGVMLTVPSKQEILGYMKQMMQTEGLNLYYDADLIAEINVERFELTKTGQIQFSHPDGTHDDQLWSLALAVYASRTPDTSYMGHVIGVPKS
jgi:phage FluMu gp28-like protein